MNGQTYLRYEAALDPTEEDEAHTGEEIARVLRSIQETTRGEEGRDLRAVHAKSHGLLKARLSILPNLAPELRQGIFANARDHDVLMRFSTIPGDTLPDSVSTPRGLGLRVFDVEGARLEGPELSHAQDFIAVNGPAFNASSAKAFLKALKLVAKTTDKAKDAKVALSATLRPVEHLVEAFGGSSAGVKALGGEPAENILGELFYAIADPLWGLHRQAPNRANLSGLESARRRQGCASA